MLKHRANQKQRHVSREEPQCGTSEQLVIHSIPVEKHGLKGLMVKTHTVSPRAYPKESNIGRVYTW